MGRPRGGPAAPQRAGFALQQRVFAAANDVDHGELLVGARIAGPAVAVQRRLPAAAGLLLRLRGSEEQLASGDAELALEQMRPRGGLVSLLVVALTAERLEVRGVVGAAARQGVDTVHLKRFRGLAVGAGVIVSLATRLLLLPSEVTSLFE